MYECFRYKRVFAIGNEGVTTYNPSSMDITNQWQYSDLINVVPSAKGVPGSNTAGGLNEFLLVFKKGKKSDTMRFSSEFRPEILTEVLVYRNKFAEASRSSFVSSWRTITWHILQLNFLFDT